MSVDTVEQAAPHTEVAPRRNAPEAPTAHLHWVLIAVVGVLLLIGLASTGSAGLLSRTRLTQVQLPTVTLPGHRLGLRAALPRGCGRLPVRPDARSVAGVGGSRGRAGCRYGLPDLGGVWS